jgi:hypothetical protein
MKTKKTTHHNAKQRRPQKSPVWRRLYLLGIIEGRKARLIEAINKLPTQCGKKEIDALIEREFAGKAKK